LAEAAGQPSDQCGADADVGVGDELVEKGEDPAEHEERHEFRRPHQQRAEGFNLHQALDHGVALQRRQHAECREHKHGTD
jgi:hypothetical protein